MEKVIKIEGGHHLNGTVRISGSKNATVALIPACVLGNEPVTIYGVPNISDVQSLIVLLNELGVYVEKRDEETLYIDPTHMENIPMVSKAVSKLRASYYFMGALLGKFGHAEIKMPGGCYLGPRPIDLHLKGFEALGANIQYENGCYILDAKELKGTNIFLDISSVGATINIMMAAVYAKGRTVIENAAREPEIIDIATLLNKMGARIHGMGTSTLVIDGVEYLKGCIHEIIPDRIEAATYVIMAAAMANDMRIENIIPQHLEAIVMKLQEVGINMEVGSDFIHVLKTDKPLKRTEILTKPYPGFATDVQQPFTVLLTQAEGISKITETIYESRFVSAGLLNEMGANTNAVENVLTITGPTKLKGANLTIPDLRGGAALLLGGLIAEGTTILDNISLILRGYEDVVEKLQKVGAKIEIIE